MEEKTRVLIISGSGSDLTHFRTVFANMGAIAIGVGKAFDAIRLFKEKSARNTPFDLVLTTYFLPDRMTALGLAGILIDIHPEIRIMIIPTAELYEQDVRSECHKMAGNILKADLSNFGLRRVLKTIRKEIDIKALMVSRSTAEGA